MQNSKEDIERFRAELGDAATQMTTQEIDELLTYADRLANVLFDSWVEARNHKLAEDEEQCI